MNLPVGRVIEQGLDLPELAVKELLESFMARGFSGYVVNTIIGYSGIEEGMLLFRQGVSAGAFFEYFSVDKTFFGDYSLQQVFNSFAAEKGVVDIVGLSIPQVDLITAFNENIRLSVQFDKRDFLKYFTKSYSTDFALQVLQQTSSEGKDNRAIFKKLGLSGLGE